MKIFKNIFVTAMNVLIGFNLVYGASAEIADTDKLKKYGSHVAHIFSEINSNNLNSLKKTQSDLKPSIGLRSSSKDPDSKHPDCKLCTKFSDIPAPYRVLETEHVKVLMNDNQYYLGRLVIVSKTPANDSEFRHFPEMETLFKKRPAVFKQMMQVLYATHEGRRAWLQEFKLPAPEPFNELIANNLAYGREQTSGFAPDPHAHIHSWMRYKQPIVIAYADDFRDIRMLASDDAIPANHKKIKFIDTEFGEPILFGKDHNIKLPDPVLKWIANGIAKKTEIFLRQAGVRVIYEG